MLPWKLYAARVSSQAHMTVLVFIICCQVVFLARASLGKKLGELRPVDPNCTIGEPLDMVCTLSSRAMELGYNSSQMYMTFDDDIVPAQLTTVASPSILVMKYNLLRIDHHSNIVCCLLLTDREVECQHLWVGHRPFKPTVNAVSVSNWEEIIWTWTTEGNNTVYNTTYAAWWKESSNSIYNRCSRNRTSARCTDKFSELEGTYHIKVNASNLVGTASSAEVTVVIDQLVAPGSVKNLEVSKTSPRSLTLQWETPKEGHSIVYIISYHSKWNVADIVKTLPPTQEETISYVLTNLRPFTEYAIRVWGRAALPGPVASVEGKTEQTVPEMAPPVSSGGYETLLASSDWRKVRLHWKAVPEIYRNGLIKNYCIKYLNATAHWKTICTSPSMLSVDVPDLLSNHTYNFYTQARGDEGGGVVSVCPITVPSTNNIPDVPNNFTVIVLNDSSVQLSWQPERLLKSATVFWCLDSVQGTCKGELEWESAGNASSIVLTPFTDSPFIYKFGLSAQSLVGSTGIAWSTCIHDITVGAPPPTAQLKTKSGTSLVLNIKAPVCTGARGFIYAYTVEICEIKSKTEMKCSGKQRRHTFLVQEWDLYTIKGLSGRQLYLMQVGSITVAGTSHYNVSLTARTAKGGLTSTSQIVIGIVALIALIFILAGIFACFRSLRGAYHKCLHWFKQPVERPKVYQVPVRYVPDNSAATYRQVLPIPEEDDDEYLGTLRTYVNTGKVNAPVGRALPIIPNEYTSTRPVFGAEALCVEEEGYDSKVPLLKPVLPPVSGSDGKAMVCLSPNSTVLSAPVLPPLSESPTATKHPEEVESDLMGVETEDSGAAGESDEMYRKTELINLPLCVSGTEEHCSPSDDQCSNNSEAVTSVLDPAVEGSVRNPVRTGPGAECGDCPVSGDDTSRLSHDSSIEDYSTLVKPAETAANPESGDCSKAVESADADSAASKSSTGYARTKVTEPLCVDGDANGTGSPTDGYAPTNLVLTKSQQFMQDQMSDVSNNKADSPHTDNSLTELHPRSESVPQNQTASSPNVKGALHKPNGILQQTAHYDKAGSTVLSPPIEPIRALHEKPL